MENANLLDKGKNKGNTNSIFRFLQGLGRFGMNYDDMVVRQSKAVGSTEATLGTQVWDEEGIMALKLSDIGGTKYYSIFDKSYKDKRKFLRDFSLNPEIEFILDTLSDEAIVYDESNFFAYADTKRLALTDKIEEEIHRIYSEIYGMFGFADATIAWGYFRQYLIEGNLAFEIIYSSDNKKIIGFKELDSISLRPSVEKTPDGKFVTIYHQYENIPQYYRKLMDNQVIYISYLKNNTVNGRVSYIERLVRSFNLLRLMENSRVMWNIMNSTFRMKMIVPIGKKSPQQAQQSLAQFNAIYREDINLDLNSGEFTVQGKPGIQFYKNYIFPTKDGAQVEMESIAYDGPDLSNMDAVNFFKDKLKIESKIPFERFQQADGGGGFGGQSSDVVREEVRFANFISRLRSNFQEILLKPLYIQTLLNYPQLRNDRNIKTNLGLRFIKNNLFEEDFQGKIEQQRIDRINALAGLMKKDKEGNEIPYFDIEFLIKEYLKMPQEFFDRHNEFIKEKEKKEKKEQPKKEEGDEDTQEEIDTNTETETDSVDDVDLGI